MHYFDLKQAAIGMLVVIALAVVGSILVLAFGI